MLTSRIRVSSFPFREKSQPHKLDVTPRLYIDLRKTLEQNDFKHQTDIPYERRLHIVWSGKSPNESFSIRSDQTRPP